MIKVDPVGDIHRRVLNEVTGGGEGSLAPLSGTILRVPEPVGESNVVPVSGGGPGWSFQGTVNATSLNPGETLTVEGILNVSSRTPELLAQRRLEPKLDLERVAGPSGEPSLANNLFTSVFLTATGFPIERRESKRTTAGVGTVGEIELAETAPNTLEAALSLSLTVPSDLQEGFYRPFLHFYMSEDTLAGVIKVDHLALSPRDVYLPILMSRIPRVCYGR